MRLKRKKKAIPRVERSQTKTRTMYAWTPEIDEFIVDNYAKLGCARCSELLDVPYRVVQSRALKKLNVKVYSSIDWTDERIAYLKEHYPLCGSEIASNMGLPVTAVQKKASELRCLYEPKDNYISTQGYRVLGKSTSRKAEHRLVMEKKLGRKLKSSELVHHEDENKLNNDPSNLSLTNRGEHCKTHSPHLNKQV